METKRSQGSITQFFTKLKDDAVVLRKTPEHAKQNCRLSLLKKNVKKLGVQKDIIGIKADSVCRGNLLTGGKHNYLKTSQRLNTSDSHVAEDIDIPANTAKFANKVQNSKSPNKKDQLRRKRHRETHLSPVKRLCLGDAVRDKENGLKVVSRQTTGQQCVTDSIEQDDLQNFCGTAAYHVRNGTYDFKFTKLNPVEDNDNPKHNFKSSMVGTTYTNSIQADTSSTPVNDSDIFDDSFLDDITLLTNVEIAEKNQSSECVEACKEGTALVSNHIPNESQLKDVADSFRSLLVLEVKRSHWTDASGRTFPEKILRLFEEETKMEKFCFLRGDWEMLETSAGDIVYVKGLDKSDATSCVIDDNSDDYITLYPDTLVSGTTVATSTTCLRQAVLQEYFKTAFQNEAMLTGSLLHDLFDWAIETKDFTSTSLRTQALKLLKDKKSLDGLYACGISETTALLKIVEYFPLIEEWSQRFVKKLPTDAETNFEFKTGHESSMNSNVWLRVDKVQDIEENIWCPALGLKGKVDVTTEVAIHKNCANLKNKTNWKTVEKHLVPMELKTGKMFNKLGTVEHRAQVILYTLLLAEKYNIPIDVGLLLYMKTGHMQCVPAPLREKRALLLKRNMLAKSLSFQNTKRQMPGLLKNKRQCGRCPQLRQCMLYHKSMENGCAETSGIGDMFGELTGHLSKEELDYFSKWFGLCMAELSEEVLTAKQKDLWHVNAVAREKSGRTLSGLILASKREGLEFSGKSIYGFKRSPNSPHLGTPMNSVSFGVGDTVTLSQEKSRTYVLGYGRVMEIDEDDVAIEFHRKIAFARSCDVTFRVDYDSAYISSLFSMSSLATLFSSSSDNDRRIRRLVLGLDAPSFSNSTISGLSKASRKLGPLSYQVDKRFSVSCDKAVQVQKILSLLNLDQRRAVERALSALDYVMILGMPGTGKTTTVTHLVQALVCLNKSVLVVSYTNSAVDNILQKLAEMNVDILRVGSSNSIHQKIKRYSDHELSAGFKSVEELKTLYETKPVVGTTCLGVKHSLFSTRRFDYCIIDEASQVTQPVCISPLKFANTFVLVGDHYQLPPLIQSVEARMKGMEESLFKFLSEKHPSAVVTLEHQYRMNKRIMDLANSVIYSHRMVCGTDEIADATIHLPKLAQLSEEQDIKVIIDPSRPLVFVDTDNVPYRECHSGSMVYNEGEATLVVWVTRALYQAGLQVSDIGIISPYRKQLSMIRGILTKAPVCPFSQEKLEINTVDKFQGRDKKCIIVSLVRSNEKMNAGELLKDWRRVNVAITRAKQKLILLGSTSTMEGSMVMRRLIKILRVSDAILPAPILCDVAHLF